jgi:hypothetical protein
MSEPMPPKHRVSLTEILTVDDLINLISMKAHTRAGRIVTGVSSVVLLAAIIVGPIIIRSDKSGAGPSSTPTIPVVTVPPSTNVQTAYVKVPFPVDTYVNDTNRYGENPNRAAPTTAPPPPSTTVAPPTTVPPPPPVTAPAAVPQATFPPATFPPATFPPATSPPPTSPPATTPLTIPPGGVITP